MRCGRQAQLLGLGQDASNQHVVRQRGGEPRGRAHRVAVLVVPVEWLADVHAVVQGRDEQEQREEAPSRAVPPAAEAQGHHWDWAPSTMSVVSFSRARRRPSGSLPGS